jgi:two-component sensor histidine kinase/CHASE3 domain sensor protein
MAAGRQGGRGRSEKPGGMAETEHLDADAIGEGDMGRSWALFAGLVAVLLLLGVAVGWATLTQRQAREEAEFYAQATGDLQSLLIDTLDAETGQRGYLITGNSAYLEPYLAAKVRLASNQSRLEARFAGPHPDEFTADGTRLWPLLEAKLAELDRTVALYSAGERERALAEVNAGTGKRSMDALRSEVGRLSALASGNGAQAFASAERREAMLLPLDVVLGLAIIALTLASLRSERRRAAAARSARDAADLRRANQRAELLLRELNHRVKNIFAVVIAIVSMASRRHPQAKELAEDIRARLHALSLAHSASMGDTNVDAVPLRTLLERTLEPYRAEGRIGLSGPEVTVPDRAITPLGLIVHELATNAAKHGALAAESGHIEVVWTTREEYGVTLSWTETSEARTPPPAAGSPGGFGTRMLDLASRQLGGSLTREWRDEGLALTIEFRIEPRP